MSRTAWRSRRACRTWTREYGGFTPTDYYDPRWDYDGVHEIHQMIRKVLDEFPETMAVGEIWVTDEERLSRYLRPDELHLAFNFRLVLTHFDADAMRTAIQRSLTVPHEGRRAA